ncbi:hypothetical protein HOE67_01640 [Candidatus Peregrinibacteria bacterium]|jgi:hypothetical protein|nr:hypothetical protein [Candidatus Peregrinibacteria bacterium]MBT4055790.1 hypothetical protein [Candidatus Peregrinibacteria bacterium]
MAEKKAQNHKFMLFWLGLLTGVLVTSLLFLYKAYTPDMSADVFRVYRMPMYSSYSMQMPVTNIAMPDPKGY